MVQEDIEDAWDRPDGAEEPPDLGLRVGIGPPKS
jgi:hypothetical protein